MNKLVLYLSRMTVFKIKERVVQLMNIIYPIFDKEEFHI